MAVEYAVDIGIYNSLILPCDRSQLLQRYDRVLPLVIRQRIDGFWGMLFSMNRVYHVSGLNISENHFLGGRNFTLIFYMNKTIMLRSRI